MNLVVRALLVLGLFTLPAWQPTLTLEQQVGQMFMVTIHGTVLPEVGVDFLQRWQPGAAVLLTSNAGPPQAVAQLTNSYQQAMISGGGLPLLIAIDHEGGRVQRLTAGFTTLPVPALINAAQDLQLAFDYGQLMAEELRAVGINMNLAPVADLETNPANPIIRRRAFGSNPHMVGQTISQVIQGMQTNGVVATVKHFPGHGETDRDSHVELPVLDLSLERLQTTELIPFAQAIDAGADAVMVAHLWFPQLDPQAELPASLSYNVVQDLLREQLGFEGIIMTDALDMDAIDQQFSYAQAAVMAVQAGVDLLTMGPGLGLDTQAAMIQAVIDAVRAGIIPETRIQASAARILAVKERYGLLDWQPLDPAAAVDNLNLPQHQMLIDTLFQSGVTLVYDRHDLLPLSADSSVAIAFLTTRNYTQPTCAAYHPAIRWVGVAQYPSPNEIAWAQDAARRTDVIVVFTENADNNSAQQALVRALPPEKTVVVALSSPYDWLAFPEVAGYMLTHSPLPNAIPAACAALFGAVPVQGRLPVTLAPDLPAGTYAN
jgi:beta-N-acetylhexosaminidase